MCICICCVCVLLWGLLCFNFLAALRGVWGELGFLYDMRMKSIRSMLVSKTVFVVSHSVGQFVLQICKPLKNLSIFCSGFFVFLSLSGNNFVNIDCISIWSQNKLEESLLSVFVVLFSTLSA